MAKETDPAASSTVAVWLLSKVMSSTVGCSLRKAVATPAAARYRPPPPGKCAVRPPVRPRGRRSRWPRWSAKGRPAY
eukprot:5653577-Alexandrium_andersonii.AAC.1